MLSSVPEPNVFVLSLLYGSHEWYNYVSKF